jgi:hypothetical protein
MSRPLIWAIQCRPNGVRAIGYIFNICPQELLQRELERDVKDAVVAVIKSMESGTFKVCSKFLYCWAWISTDS